MKYSPQARIRLLSVCVIIVMIFFGIRLFFLQVIKGEDYSFVADKQYTNSASTLFDRGTIYFTEKSGNLVPAATLKQEFVITANPQLVLNSDAVYTELTKIIPLDKEKFMAQVSDKTRVYGLIASGLDRETAEKIKAQNLRGIFVDQEKKRYYPAGKTASHVLGFMAYQGEDYAGRYGLEKGFEDIIGRDKSKSFSGFFTELFLGLGKTLIKEEGTRGDIVLTIEPMVQNTVEEELAKLADKWQVDQAGAIVMDPKTGEILALAAWPDFNPGASVDDISILSNPLVQQVHEMGSVVKALSMAIGLDTKAVTPTTTYYDAGYINLNKRRIANYDGEGRGTVNMQEVLNQSLNTGVAFVAGKVGNRRFGDYLLKFGLGEKTGIDLPDEVPGLVENLHSNRDVEYATASFGQGIAVTPMAITRAFGALANNGQLVKPHVVKKIIYEDGSDMVIKPEFGDQVVKPETTKVITGMLVKAVDTALVGGKYKMPHYSLAAKTGTAQISDEESGGYYNDRFLHSFFGYYPASNPRFITFFYIMNPKGVRYASETLTEPFMTVAQFLLNYYEVPPDR